MSGGHFNYDQHRITEIADEILELIKNNNTQDEWGHSNNFPPDIIKRFLIARTYLRRVAVMVQRIDWLVSGDDGDDSFRRRWDEDLAELEKES